MEDDEGISVSGVVMPSKFGNPEGTTKVTKTWGKKAVRTQTVGDSTNELRSGQTADAFAQSKKNLINSFHVKAGADDDGPCKVAAKAKPRK
eukprot:230282-Lingulodinium_polyedra.AAC.1